MDGGKKVIEFVPLVGSQCDDVSSHQSSQRQQQQHGTRRKSLDMLGVSVHHMRTDFMTQVLDAVHNADSSIYEIEDLSCSSDGVIRRRGAKVRCPIDGRVGASYVHSLNGEDHVGVANFMLSYSWRSVHLYQPDDNRELRPLHCFVPHAKKLVLFLCFQLFRW